MGIETLAMASLGAGVLGGGISAFGGLRAGSAAAQAANYRAAVAGNYAQFARQKGMVDAQAQGMRTGALIGKQTAIQSAGGLDVNSGSNVDVRASTAQMGRLDELTIVNNAENKALGLENEAELDSMKARNAQEEAKWNVASSILGTASSVGSKWASFKTAGVFS